MKNSFLTILSLLVISCGGSSGNDTPPAAQNTAPTIPSLVYPTNNLLCIDNTLEFKWNASTDQENDQIIYEINIATDNQFNEVVHNTTANQLSKVFDLEKGTAYYWRVKAIDTKDKASDYSGVWQFHTEGEGTVNHLPFIPALVKPSINALVQETSTTLEWTASDVDNDTLTYDVYFGDSTPPPLVAENQTESTYNANLSSATDYFWKIVVRDDKGGATVGHVWSFKTD